MDNIFNSINQNKYLKNINKINIEFTNIDIIKLKNEFVNLILKLKTFFETSVKISINYTYENNYENTILNCKHLYINNENKISLINNYQNRIYFMGDKNSKNNCFYEIKEFKKKINDIYMFNITSSINYLNNSKNNIGDLDKINNKKENDNTKHKDYNLIIKTINIENYKKIHYCNKMNESYYVEYKIYINNIYFNFNKNYIVIRQYFCLDKKQNIKNKNYFTINLVIEVLEDDKIQNKKLKEIIKIIYYIYNLINN